jgi:hypothetical protein
MLTITRTYEAYAVAFARGTRVTGFDTEAEAVAYLGAAAGEVERSTFDVEIAAERLHLYRPGIAETVAPAVVRIAGQPATEASMRVVSVSPDGNVATLRYVGSASGYTFAAYVRNLVAVAA